MRQPRAHGSGAAGSLQDPDRVPGLAGRRLVGKVALVTGASRGGGKGIALVLGEEGSTVYVSGRSVSREESLLYESSDPSSLRWRRPSR
jgi:hypothetical protein